MEEVYEPGEDTYLLIDTLKREAKYIKRKKVIEIGCGSGIVSQYLSTIASLVIAGDINKRAVSKAQKLLSATSHTYFVIGDGATYISPSKIDIFVFNPPYLPSYGKIMFRDLEGGKEGIEVTYNFLSQILTSSKRENENKRIYFITSSLSNIRSLKNKVRKLCTSKGIRLKWDVLSSLIIDGEKIEVNRILF